MTKFKHMMYNTYKGAMQNFHSKQSIKLSENGFFKPVSKQDQYSLLLHEVYINRAGSKEEDVALLNRKFAIAFRSITWFTYRDSLEFGIAGSKEKSDAGWGCMIRTGQMILM